MRGSMPLCRKPCIPRMGQMPWAEGHGPNTGPCEAAGRLSPMGPLRLDSGHAAKRRQWATPNPSPQQEDSSCAVVPRLPFSPPLRSSASPSWPLPSARPVPPVAPRRDRRLLDAGPAPVGDPSRLRPKPAASFVPKARPGGGSGTGASWTKGGAILKASGKVYFVMGSSAYVCSGSVATETKTGKSLVLRPATVRTTRAAKSVRHELAVHSRIRLAPRRSPAPTRRTAAGRPMPSWSTTAMRRPAVSTPRRPCTTSRSPSSAAVASPARRSSMRRSDRSQSASQGRMPAPRSTPSVIRPPASTTATISSTAPATIFTDR